VRRFQTDCCSHQRRIEPADAAAANFYMTNPTTRSVTTRCVWSWAGYAFPVRIPVLIVEILRCDEQSACQNVDDSYLWLVPQDVKFG
jgi:hypothetical protein